MARQKIRKLNQEDKKTLLRVLRYIRQYRHLVLLSLLLSALSVVMSLYIPVLIGRAVDRIVGKGEVDFRALFGILRLMLFFIFASALSQWLMNHINNIVSYHVVEDIRTKLFSRIQNLPLSYLDSHPAGDTVSRVITDIDQFSQGLLLGFSQLFTGLLTILETLIFLFFIDIRIALLVVLLTPLSFLAASFIAKSS